MADVDPLNFNTQAVTNTASGVVDFVIIMMIGLFALLLLWGCLYLLSFNKQVLVRNKTASGYVVIQTKAREFTTKDGVKKWRFLKWIKSSYVAPTTDYIEFTKKGKYFVECDRSTDGSIHWRKRSDKPESMDEFTSEERLITATEMRRANEYMKGSGWDKVWQAAPAIICVIIVVLLLAFWGDFVKSSSAAADKAAEASNKLSIASDRLAQAMSMCYNPLNQTNTNLKVDTKGQNLPPVPN